MEKKRPLVAFIGAGSIGTALGNIMAENSPADVLLHSIESSVADDINIRHTNTRYFPTMHLHPRLVATTDDRKLGECGILFLAIPSVVLVDYLKTIREHFSSGALLVNLAKGFGSERQTIYQCLRSEFPNPVCTMKGPSFAREIINQLPTGFTLGYEGPVRGSAEPVEPTELPYPLTHIPELFRGTNIHFDFSSDIQGVEILSILKNIYAVVLGIVDAQFNSPNLRFLVLTKAFREMRRVLLHFGGREDTLFNYCGYGDFTLTALNDLSRNRTLGLLIGKGFFSEHVSHELVLEGKTAVNVFYDMISSDLRVGEHFPVIAELHKILNTKYDISRFVKTILELPEK